jgi:T-complex protein 1 subunit beta
MVKLGTCGLTEEIMIGEDKIIKFTSTAAGEAWSIVLKGSASHILD